MPLHHWTRVDINKLVYKLVVRFTDLIDVDEDTLSKSDIQETKAVVGCDNPDSIPKEFNAVIENQLYTIKIRVTARIFMPRDPALND